IKRARLLHVGRRQLTPAGRTWRADQLDAEVLLRLPDRKRSAGRGFEDRPAPALHYVTRRTESLGAELGDLSSGLVRAVDGDVRHPVRRNPFHLRAELIDGADVFAVLCQRRIDAAHLRRQRRIFEPPAEEPYVKLFGRVLIARSEFEPAEIA